MLGVESPRFAQGRQEEVVLGVALVVVAEVSLGGKGVTTTSDGRGPLVSPPVVVVVEELLVLVVEAVKVVVEELGPGWCLPLIQV